MATEPVRPTRCSNATRPTPRHREPAGEARVACERGFPGFFRNARSADTPRSSRDLTQPAPIEEDADEWVFFFISFALLFFFSFPSFFFCPPLPLFSLFFFWCFRFSFVFRFFYFFFCDRASSRSLLIAGAGRPVGDFRATTRKSARRAADRAVRPSDRENATCKTAAVAKKSTNRVTRRRNTPVRALRRRA